MLASLQCANKYRDRNRHTMPKASVIDWMWPATRCTALAEQEGNWSNTSLTAFIILVINCVSIQMRLIWLGSRGLIRVGCGWLRCVYLNATYIGPWIQRSHLSWISDIRVLRFSQKKDKAVTENWSKLNYQYTSRYADLFDKYCQVFSDSTGFLWSNFHGRKFTECRLSQRSVG